MNWHFSPLSLQYIIGGSLSLIITGYVLYKNPKTVEIISFFLFGLFVSTWNSFNFLHRNAPTAELSGLFFRIAMFSLLLVLAFLLLTILSIRRPKSIYLLWVAPAFIGGIFESIFPIEILWSNWGWAYKFSPMFRNICYGFLTTYSVLVFSSLAFLIKQSKGSALSKKYKIILCGTVLYSIGSATSNYIIFAVSPDFPPLGGVLTTILFLLVAYAINLRTEKIRPSFKVKEPLEKFSSSYLQFLNTFRNAIPGKELGRSSFRFVEYIEAMGLKNVVVPESGKLIFKVDKLSDVDINGISDNILKIMKEHPWARKTINDFTPVLVRTYETVRLKSKGGANEWLEQMLQRHGSFLAKHGVLAAMPKKVKIPEVFKELQPGRTYLFNEEKPAQAYKKLKQALNYGFVSLCISKLHPQKVRERYHVGKASIFWLTFKEAEGTINPKDFVKLNGTISGFVKRSGESIVLIDCFDQIKFANGFQKSLTMLKGFRDLCKEHNSIVLISINPEMFEKRELAAIEKELEEVRIE